MSTLRLCFQQVRCAAPGFQRGASQRRAGSVCWSAARASS